MLPFGVLYMICFLLFIEVSNAGLIACCCEHNAAEIKMKSFLLFGAMMDNIDKNKNEPYVRSDALMTQKMFVTISVCSFCYCYLSID